MNIGKPFKKRRTPVESLLPRAVYMHYMDNTEEIPGNQPQVVFTTNKSNPFGRPGVDYSAGYRWGYIRLVPDQPAKGQEGTAS